MTFFDNLNWRITKLLLSCFGAWPSQSPRIRKILRVLVFFLIASIFLPEIIKLITAFGDINKLVECAPIFALHSLTIVKMCNCLFNIDKIKILLIKIQTDWESPMSDVELQMLRKYGNDNRRLTHGYIYFIYAVTAMFLTTPMVPKILDYYMPLNQTRPQNSLYQTEYFVDPVQYEIPILIHAYIVSPFPTTVIVAFDSLYANFVNHACSMFVVIGYRLKNVANNKYVWNKRKKVIREDRMHQLMINHIKHHNNILEYCQILKSTYNSCLLCIVMINMLALSITGFQTVMKMNETSEMIRFGTFSIGQVVHLFFLSWPGQRLLDHSLSIHQLVYSGEWYNISSKTKKLSIFIMMRSRKPCILSAGKMYTMSCESFSKVIKTSMSYFTLLTSLK
ncbi:odorant receptor 49b-like [Microplitis mediator]|uniref:odorant receptor 49b-like n=1 Tax=Microplitis mediator TaxID=375433 RepID=UPI00255219BD|nr:odorant receptor 49b-like [Microplitis mediator]